MADRYSYVDLASLKSQMAITDTTDDTLLLAKLEAASRYIDGPFGCNRRFYAKAVRDAQVSGQADIAISGTVTV